VPRRNHLNLNLYEDPTPDVPKLGGLVSRELDIEPPLSGVDEGEMLNAKFALSVTQRALLSNHPVDNKSKRNDQILEKRDKLPQRFQRLTEDIALLHYRSLFSEENWEDGLVQRRINQRKDYHKIAEAIDQDELNDTAVEESQSDTYETSYESSTALWRELLDISYRTDYVRDDVYFNKDFKEVELGFEIGSMLQILRPDEYISRFDQRQDVDNDIVGAGLLWGFIMAFIGQPRSKLDEEKRQLDYVFDLFNDLHNARRQNTQRMPSPEEMDDFRKLEQIVQAIEEKGLTADDILIEEVRYHCPAPNKGERTKRLSRGIVDKIIEITPIEEVDELTDILAPDQETIRDRSVPGADSARQVLQGVWALHQQKQEHSDSTQEDSGTTAEPQDSTGSEESGANSEFSESTDEDNADNKETIITSEAIGQEVSVEQSTVTEVLNRVSGDDSSELWTNQEIVRGTSADRGTEWELTDYGALLCHICFECDGDTSRLYRYAIGPEELSLYERKLILQALDELHFVK